MTRSGSTPPRIEDSVTPRFRISGETVLADTGDFSLPLEVVSPHRGQQEPEPEESAMGAFVSDIEPETAVQRLSAATDVAGPERHCATA